MAKTKALIIGGGVAGLATAVSLSQRGVKSLVVEKDAVLGGMAAQWTCKATDKCARCGACRLNDLLTQVAERPEITVCTGTKVTGCKVKDDKFKVTVEGPEGEDKIKAQAVVVAAGFQPFDPGTALPHYGYGVVPGVVTNLELEQSLRRGELPSPGGKPVKKVAFIQCVGSRNVSLGRPWCSRVCCGVALRCAQVLKNLDSEVEVTFFHMDTQDYGRAWETALPDLRKQINFVRAMPYDIFRTDDGPKVTFCEMEADATSEQVFDLVSLSVGMGPARGLASLCEALGVEADDRGFAAQGQDAATDTPGVFLAGAAAGPCSILESIDHGELAAAGVYDYLGGK